MKTDLKTIQDTFKFGYEIYLPSRYKHAEVVNMYHNRQYTAGQLRVLNARKQPAETFNIIKLFTRALDGYASATMNTIKVEPKSPADTQGAILLTESIDYVRTINHSTIKDSQSRKDAILAGLQVTYIRPFKTDNKDNWGRSIWDTDLARVNPAEVVLDPMSAEPDYSDARFIHRFKWVSEDSVIKLWGKEVLKDLDGYHNHVNVDEADFSYRFNGQFVGKYKVYDNYLIIHTVIEDNEGNLESVYWCDDKELERTKLEYPGQKFPYKVNKINDCDTAEYYGVFNDVTESQKAINQALLQIQRLVNTNKVFVEEGTIPEKMTDVQFQAKLDRINSLIKVRRLKGIKVEDMSQDVIAQYTIIDKALDRIKQILHINDSFLGMAFASDSGKKVALQQNSTIVALSYLIDRLEFNFKMIGTDLVSIMQANYNFTFFLNKDEIWKELNKPVMMPRQLNDGSIVREPILEEVSYNEETGESVLEYVIAPSTEFRYSDVNITVTTAAYNDTDEADRLMLEQTIQGPAGQALLNVSPPLYFKMVAMSTKSNKTRNSEAVAELFTEAAVLLGGSPTMDPRQMLSQMGMPGAGGDNTPASQMASTMGLSNRLEQ